jgi:hypothetical protein
MVALREMNGSNSVGTNGRWHGARLRTVSGKMQASTFVTYKQKLEEAPNSQLLFVHVGIYKGLSTS